MFFFSSRRRHTRCALVTGVQTCALPISNGAGRPRGAGHAVPRLSRQVVPVPVTPDETPGHHRGSRQRLFLDRLAASRRLPRRCTRLDLDDGDCLSLPRSEEHTSALQSIMRKSYAAFYLKKNIHNTI